MRRREFIGLVSGAAAAWPPAALWPCSGYAQTSPKRPLIGFLAPGFKVAGQPYYSGIPQGLQDFGYVEGRDYMYEARYADGELSRLPSLAQELVRLRPNVIIAPTTATAVAAKNATSTIPLVCPSLTDPVGSGLVVSQAHPGTNVTGVLNRVEGLLGKQVEIALDIVPGANKFGVLFNANNPANLSQQRDVETAAAKRGASLIPVDVHSAGDLGPAFQTFARERADIAIVIGDAMFLSLRRQIAAFALASHVPTLFTARESVEAGGLISYGVNLHANYRRAGYFVDRILKGEKPADLPIEFPTKLELVINLATAKAIGLSIPSTLLARADEVIE